MCRVKPETVGDLAEELQPALHHEVIGLVYRNGHGEERAFLIPEGVCMNGGRVYDHYRFRKVQAESESQRRLKQLHFTVTDEIIELPDSTPVVLAERFGSVQGREVHRYVVPQMILREEYPI